MISRPTFFTRVRATLSAGLLNQGQVDGMNSILDRWELGWPAGDPRWISYILGTCHHETDRTMAPIEEYGHGGERLYAKPDPETGIAYWGRGFVQLTWKDNYQKMGDRLGLDLVNHPELALDLKHATEILIVGMVEGRFTGVSLAMYFNDAREDWINARRIVNGLDRAWLVAGYSKKYLAAIQDAQAVV